MAIPTYVNHGAGVAGPSAITPPLPAGLAVDDILLAYFETAAQTVTITNPNGGAWTLVGAVGVGTPGNTSASGLTVFWSRYNGTQGAPTTGDPGDHNEGYIAAFRGCKATGNPYNVESISIDDVNDASLAATGDTTTVDDCLVVVVAALPDDSFDFGATWTNADLANIVNRQNIATSTGGDGRLMTVTGEKATAGAYGNTTNTLNGSVATKAMMTIALAPVGPGTSQSKTDLVGLVDAGTAELFHDFDPLGLVDSLAVVMAAVRTPTDPLGLTDSIVVALIGVGEGAYSDGYSNAYDGGIAPATTAGKDLGLLWDVQATVGDSANLVWDIKAAVGDNAQLVWDIHTAVGDSAQLVWDIHTAVGDSAQLVWDILAAVGDDLELVWDVLADGVVGTSIGLVWNVHAAAGDNLQTLWDVRSFVAADDLNVVWDIRTMVGDTVELKWGVRTLIGDTAVIVWDVRRLVSDDLELIWDVDFGDLRNLQWGFARPRSRVAVGKARQ